MQGCLQALTCFSQIRLSACSPAQLQSSAPSWRSWIVSARSKVLVQLPNTGGTLKLTPSLLTTIGPSSSSVMEDDSPDPALSFFTSPSSAGAESSNVSDSVIALR